MNRRTLGVASALLVTLAASACGSGGPTAGASGSATPTVAPYLTAVPSAVALTAPGTALRLGQHAVIAWKSKVDQTAVLDVQVTRIERTTYDRSFQGWKVTAAQAATTPYFVRAVVTNESTTPLDRVSVPIWAEQDSGTLIAPQPFRQRTFQPCHPYITPASFAPGKRIDMCFVFRISPGQDLRTVTFRPYDENNQPLQSVTWAGHVSTKVQPPATEKPKKRSKGNKSTKAAHQ